MKCVKSGKKRFNEMWQGRCRMCGAKFEAERHELKVDRCPREGYEFAHADCSECCGKSGSAVILYPGT